MEIIDNLMMDRESLQEFFDKGYDNY